MSNPEDIINKSEELRELKRGFDVGMSLEGLKDKKYPSIRLKSFNPDSNPKLSP